MVSAASHTIDAATAQKLQRALTAGKDELYAIVAEATGDVLRAALRNPLLDEGHLLALLKRRDLGEDLLTHLYGMDAIKDSHRLKVALVRNPGTTGRIVLALLPHLYLFELLAICHLPGATPDQKLAAERTIIQRLPATNLGNKITLARRGTALLVEEILKEGDPALVEACLSSPRLKESSIYRFICSARVSAETIRMVARHERWKKRPNLQQAILKNPKTPSCCFSTIIATMPVGELRSLMIAGSLGERVKKELAAELKRRGVKM